MGVLFNTFWGRDWQLWLVHAAPGRAKSHNACPTCLLPSGVLLFKPLHPLLSPGRETAGQEEEQCEEEPLRALEGKHRKPAGLALESAEGQGEAEEVRKAKAWTEQKEEIKKVKSLAVGTEETENPGLCEGSTQVRNKC